LKEAAALATSPVLPQVNEKHKPRRSDVKVLVNADGQRRVQEGQETEE